jgi:hypothetical protein
LRRNQGSKTFITSPLTPIDSPRAIITASKLNPKQALSSISKRGTILIKTSKRSEARIQCALSGKADKTAHQNILRRKLNEMSP